LASAETLLHLVMTRGGMVNRIGNGEHPGGRMAMGRPEDPIFEDWLNAFRQVDAKLEHSGRYHLPEPKGEPSELSISLSGEDFDQGYAFYYGSESMGPPEEFLALTELALDLSEDWYQDQTSKQRR
ncbi:MAG: hypothetical protein AAF804_05520, partial [Bacteroidota bacterium]